MRNPIPVIVLILCSLTTAAQGVNGFEILFKSGTVRPERNITDSNLARFNRSASRTAGKTFLVLQFDRLITVEEKQQLAQQGILLHDYLPNFAYTATVSGQINAGQLRNFDARSILDLRPEQKMEPRLAIGDFPSWSIKKAGFIDCWISFPPGFTAEEVLSELSSYPVEIISTDLLAYRIISLRLEVTMLGDLAGRPFIEYLQPVPPPEGGLNYGNLTLSKANVLKAPAVVGGRTLSGDGVVIGVGDDGDMQTHIDYNSRLINRTGSSPASHASHVAGITGGAGLINELYEGYAPGVTIVGQLFSGIIRNANVYVQDHGMTITNNSYGFVVSDCPFNGLYDLNARMIDQLSLDIPDLIHVVAAGNNGTLTCFPYSSGFHTVLGGYQSAKNVITTGSTNYAGGIGGTSSRGPVKDGRIKPELTSQGVQIPSTWTNNIYSFNTGTSMAAPGVSGGLALLTELYHSENGGIDPKAALLKAIITNGAADRENTGPDFKYGFGNMNLIRSAKMIDEATWFSSSVAQGITNTHQINVPANTAQLKVLLYWHDPPAAMLSAKTLVNDLDLRVESVNGTVLPFRLDTAAANLNTAATTGADHTNNIEQVVIDNPPAGAYDLKVTGTLIAQNPNQEYFLVYDTIASGLTLTNPIGGERFIESIFTLPPSFNYFDSVFIQWESYGVVESGFMVEFAADGVNWVALNNGNPVNGSLRGYNWGVPQNLTTNQARIRVTGVSSGRQDTSDPFVITPTPSVTLSTSQCDGYIRIEWPAMLNVTNYEVMLLQGETWTTVATTSQLTYVFSGLSRDSIYWVTVRPMVNGTPGRRAVALWRKPADGDCAGSISDNDLRLEAITAPRPAGRVNTSTALTSAETISIRIRNLDNAPSSGSIDLNYSVNNVLIESVTISPVIAAGGTYIHDFTIPYDFSGVGNYTIETELTHAGDLVADNNVFTSSVRQLSNLPITTGDLPWNDDLESMPVQEFRIDRMGLTGRDRYDFISGNNDTGRIRSFFNSGIAHSGNRALTLDSWISSLGTVDSLTATFNLGTFSVTDDIRVDFRYKNHGQRSNAANKVWVRGSDQDPWIEIFDLYASQPDNDGTYKLVNSMEINDSLDAYSQDYSSSFQMRIGQWGRHMAADNQSGAGYSIDDFRIYQAIDDIQLLAIDTPVVLACGLNATVPVKAIVRNTSASQINNIPIFLRVDGNLAASELIPFIPGNDTVHYTFTGTANLATSGPHLVEVWVDLNSDNVPDNDTARVTARNVRFVNSFPYLENFENGDGTWYTLTSSKGSWDFGTPSSAKINRAASGSKAWKTNIYGYYDNNETGYLYSPCFDVSSMSVPTLSFSLSLDIEDCGVTEFCDGAWVDFSTDGGLTWQRLGAMGQGTNWYNRNYGGEQVWSQANYYRWHVATIPLPNSPTLRLRFGFKSDVGLVKDGIAVDDIHIYDNINGIYTGTGESPASVQPVVSGTNWIDFLVGGQLIASVNPNGQNLGSTEAKSFVNTGGVRINKQQYYHDRNITIKPANVNLADSATVRFYFLDTETEALISATGCAGCYKPSMAYELGVTKYSDPNDLYENGTLSDNLQGNYLFINATKAVKVPFDKGYYAEFKVKDFSEFWLNNGGFNNNTPLPAELISFTATRNGADVLVKWTTASETDVARFEIEVARGNDDYLQGRFFKLGELASGGNSTTEQHYNFNDAEPNKSGTRFYRLRIVDIDGSVQYSQVRPVQFNSELTWQVYPNPSDGRFTLSAQARPGEWITYSVYSADGRKVKQSRVQATGFPQLVPVDISGASYPGGVYLFEAGSGEEKQVFRLVKQ